MPASPGALAPWLQAAHWENILSALVLLVILSLVLDRGLALVFEWGVWRDWLGRTKLRGPLALGAAYAMCLYGRFDLLAILVRQARRLDVAAFVRRLCDGGNHRRRQQGRHLAVPGRARLRPRGARRAAKARG